MAAWESVLVGFVPQDGCDAGKDLSLMLGSVKDPAAACRHPRASDGFVAWVPVGPGTHWPDVTSPGAVVRHSRGIVAEAAARLGAITALAHAERGGEVTLARAMTQGILRHLPVGDLMPVGGVSHANDDYPADPSEAGSEADHGEVRLYVAMRAARRAGPLMHRDLAARLARADAAVTRAIAVASPAVPRWMPCSSFLAPLPPATAFDGRLVPTLASYALDAGRQGGADRIA